jgi:DNA polymerase-1
VQDRPFIGPSGRLLDAMLTHAETERDNVFVTNAVLCRPIPKDGKDSAPGVAAARACRPRLIAELQSVHPDVTVAMGSTAVKSILQTNDSVSHRNGALEWNEEYNSWVIPTFHPAAVLRGNLSAFDDELDALKRAVGLSTGRIPSPPVIHPTPSYDLVQSESECLNALWEIRDYVESRRGDEPAGVLLALDIETGGKNKEDGLRYLDGDLLLVSIASPDKAWVFDYDAVPGGSESADVFARMLQSQDITWVLHNAKFDIQWLRHHFGAYPYQWLDTMCYALALTERGDGVGLKKLSRQYLNAGFYEDTLQVPKDASYSAVPREVLAEYAAYDVIYTVRLLPVLERLVIAEGTQKLVPLLHAAQRAFADCEYHGTAFDRDWAEHLDKLWRPKIDEMTYRLQEYAQKAGFVAWQSFKKPTKKQKEMVLLNPGSTTQLASFFFDTLRLEPPGGKRTTGKELLEAYPDHEAVKLLIELRRYEHMVHTYIDGFVDDIWGDGRVHPDILLFGAVTGRLSIHNPPLQIIPKHNVDPEIADALHRLFVASPGHTFVNVDYKQLEIRVAWLLSGDAALGQSVLTGDFHRQTASTVFRKPAEEVTAVERFQMKALTFGLMYGRGANALSKGEMRPLTGGDARIAQAYIDDFFKKYSEYAKFYQQCQRDAMHNGFLETPFGRKRRWNLISADTVSEIRTQSVNFPVQSVASDICLSSLIRLNKILQDREWGHVLFTVHDSIVIEIHDECLDSALPLIRKEMTRTDLLPLQVPANFCLDVDVEVGKNWGETAVWHE